MEIALIITAGVIIITLFSAGFDYLSKRSKQVDKKIRQKVITLETRLTGMESRLEERDNKVFILFHKVWLTQL